MEEHQDQGFATEVTHKYRIYRLFISVLLNRVPQIVIYCDANFFGLLGALNQKRLKNTALDPKIDGHYKYELQALLAPLVVSRGTLFGNHCLMSGISETEKKKR